MNLRPPSHATLWVMDMHASWENKSRGHEPPAYVEQRGGYLPFDTHKSWQEIVWLPASRSMCILCSTQQFIKHRCRGFIVLSVDIPRDSCNEIPKCKTFEDRVGIHWKHTYNQLKDKLVIMFNKIGRKRLTVYFILWNLKSVLSNSLYFFFLLCCVQLFQDLNFMNFDPLEKWSMVRLIFEISKHEFIASYSLVLLV